jgi:restriction endonuclease EcoRII-like protein
MKYQNLAELFDGVAFKRLSAVECRPDVSHQREFNGINAFREILGPSRHIFPATLVYLADTPAECLTQELDFTWYDARENTPDRSEYRLYFPPNDVMARAVENDLLLLCRRKDADSLLAVVCPTGSASESRLIRMFEPSDPGIPRPEAHVLDRVASADLSLPHTWLLEQIGLEVSGTYPTAEDLLSEMLAKFGPCFPKTKTFSEYARETLAAETQSDGPDTRLWKWIEREEALFRVLEGHIVGKQLSAGFKDVDHFIKYSLSVHNRRKSRMGLAFEHHLETVFIQTGLRYIRGATTENRAKPDFLFPGINEYNDPAFDASLLTMLGAKSTCKDRWRQVLAEADRIPNKHLATLECGVTSAQFQEMKSRNLTLVVPSPLHEWYSEDQQEKLFSLEHFIDFVTHRQNQ